MIDEPEDLRECARWYAGAAQNTSDPRIRRAMAVRAQELLDKADAFSRTTRAGLAVNAPR